MSVYYKQFFVKIETDTQYESIKPVLLEFVRDKITFDIYIPEDSQNTNNVNEMFKRTCNAISEDGFTNIVREISPRNRYHIALLAPHYQDGINAKYYIKYSYGSVHSVKPSLTHLASKLNHYHAYLVYNARDAEIFSVFCKTYILPDLKHIGYRRIAPTGNKKQTILFLPSWEDQNNLEWIVSTIKELRKKYTTIVKLHPYGDFGTRNESTVQKNKELIREIADEYYEGGLSLDELLGRSDLVISDLSGAVFDALYVGVPLIMYSKNINRFNTKGIKSANAKYVEEGYISVSKTVNELIAEIPRGLSHDYFKKQNNLSEELFRRNLTSSATSDWMKILKMYLHDNINQEYIALHNIFSNEFWYYKNETEKLQINVQNLEHKNSTLLSEVNSLKIEQNSFLSIKRSIRLVVGNIKRRAKKSIRR